MRTTKPSLNRFRWIALGIVSLTVVLIIVSSGSLVYEKVPVSPIEFGHLPVPTSSNANFVTLTVTNRSNFAVCYLTKPLQVKSNGIWSGPPGLLTGQRLTMLLPRQSGVAVVEAAWTNENTRIPVLWGYGYTSPATKWQQLREDIMGRLDGRGGRGLLFTNYVTAQKP